MKCSNCGNKVEGKYCTKCGTKVTEKKIYAKMDSKKLTVMIVAILIVFVVVMSGGREKEHIDRDKFNMDNKDYTYQTPATFNYTYKKSDEFAKLYKEALKNQEDLVYLVADDVEYGYGGFIDKVLSYKQTISLSKYLYYGDIKNGKPHGDGVLFLDNSVIYMGEFKNGYPNGFGVEFGEDLNSGSEYSILYEGYWKHGEYSGDGIRYFPLYRSFLRKFSWGTGYMETATNYYNEQRALYENSHEPHIIDVYIDCINVEYEGEFKNGKKSGDGKEYWLYADGCVLQYEGEFADGKYNGKGKTYHSSTGKIRYEGEFKDGLFHGQGKLYNENGKLEYKGKFEDGDIAG